MLITYTRGIKVLSALWIVLLGMAIIFAVLGVLLGAMVVLDKLVKPREEEKQ